MDDSVYVGAHPLAASAPRGERCGGGLRPPAGGPPCPLLGVWSLQLYGKPSRWTYCAEHAAAKLRAYRIVTAAAGRRSR